MLRDGARLVHGEVLDSWMHDEAEGTVIVVEEDRLISIRGERNTPCPLQIIGSEFQPFQYLV